LKKRNLLEDLGVDNRIILQTGCDEMDWIYLVQIRDYWQVLVNPVRNLQVLYNVRPRLVKQMLVSQQELCLQHEFVTETSLFPAAVRAEINQSIQMFNICTSYIA
jgi:hypothetical protein